jgi:hypothetical protein
MSFERRSGIEVTVRFTPINFIYYLCTPRITIDGVETETRWGTHVFPVRPGTHSVRIAFRYLLAKNAGENSIDVTVSPGLLARLRYRAPSIVFMRGPIHELTPVEAPASLADAGAPTKTCPRCEEAIKVEAHVCRHCGHEFNTAAVEDAIRQARLAESEATRRAAGVAAWKETARGQLGRYYALKRKRAGGVALVGIGVAFAAIMVAALIGVAVEGFPAGVFRPAIGSLAVAALSGAVFHAGRRQMRQSDAMRKELDDEAGIKGNYYCCACGRAKDKYYWLHYVSWLLFPYGLVSLFFPLRKCRGCGLPYETPPPMPV